MIRRTATLFLAATLAVGISACSNSNNEQGSPAETTGQGAAPASSGDQAKFSAGCQPLADIQPFMSAEAFKQDEVQKLMEKARAGAADVPEKKVKDAILAFADTPVNAGRKFSDAYTAARKACADWGATFSGGKPQGGNGGSMPPAPEGGNDAEMSLYKETCKPIIDIAQSFQQGTLDPASVPQTVEQIAPLVGDIPDADSKASLQALVTGINDGSEPMPLFVSAVQACGAWGTSLSSK